MNFINKLKLDREAILFDTPMFLVKVFFSVLTAYVVFHNHAIIGMDMISLLFGMMLTLEPVNFTGVKGGFFQLKASVIGGLLTALIIASFGVNFITVPLAVMMTMYVTLKMDWREISVVAMFTSIYMTQLIQTDTLGMPSMILTLRLRLMALGAGILVAVFYNFVFSKLTYKRFAKKRTLYLIERIIGEFDGFDDMIKKGDTDGLMALKSRLSVFFSDFDFVIHHLLDIEQESKKYNVTYYIDLVRHLRDFNHYYLDLLMDHMVEPLVYENEMEEISKQLEVILKSITEDRNIEGTFMKATDHWKFERLYMTLNSISKLKRN